MFGFGDEDIKITTVLATVFEHKHYRNIVTASSITNIIFITRSILVLERIFFDKEIFILKRRQCHAQFFNCIQKAITLKGSCLGLLTLPIKSVKLPQNRRSCQRYCQVFWIIWLANTQLRHLQLLLAWLHLKVGIRFTRWKLEQNTCTAVTERSQCGIKINIL